MSTATLNRPISGQFKSPPALFLPFSRCAKIMNLSAEQREGEYTRAAIVKLLSDSGQGKQIYKAAEGSIFRPVELLAMARKYPRTADWRKGNLWRMLQTAISGGSPVIE
jgi:hypothetical protein